MKNSRPASKATVRKLLLAQKHSTKIPFGYEIKAEYSQNSIVVKLKQQLNAPSTHAAAQLSQWKHPRDIFPISEIFAFVFKLSTQTEFELHVNKLFLACVKISRELLLS